MKHFSVVLFLILVIIISGCLHTGQFIVSDNESVICFSGSCILAEIADTPEKHSQGLMHRKWLADDRGMLFVFEDEGFHSFWMKNTFIPLDIIWIDSDFNVVDIQSAKPCVTISCALYTSGSPAKYVLEVNSGFAKKNRIHPGDKAAIERTS